MSLSSLVFPKPRVADFGLILLTTLHFFLKCVLLDFGKLLVLDLIVCIGKVGPTCCFGIRFVGFVLMA